jgi:hypothetical protein
MPKPELPTKSQIAELEAHFRLKFEPEMIKNKTGSLKLSKPMSDFFAISDILKFLDLTGNSLNKFAADLPNLMVLKLSRNKLRSVQGRYPRLVYFDICENRLSRGHCLPAMPHCHVLLASANQLIDFDEIEKFAPRLIWLEANENFLIKTPKKLNYLSKLSISNNSITHFRSDSIYLSQVDISFNNLEDDSSYGMFPLLEDSGLIWTDHVTKCSISDHVTPVKFYGYSDLIRFIKLNNFDESGLIQINHIKSLRIILESTSCMYESFPVYVRQYYSKMLKINETLRKLVGMSHISHSRSAEVIYAIKIQNWWRQLSNKKIELEKLKKAVGQIEAWWIGTNTKRKINEALKSGNDSLMSHFC